MHGGRRTFMWGYGVELLAILVSGLSLLVASIGVVWAIFTARAAQRDSQDAIEQANTANNLSAESNVIARDSKGIAIESKEVSEEALKISRRADLRESDTSDVHWKGDWENPGTYKITNRGHDKALNVRVVLTVDEEVVRITEKEVPGGGSITIDCPEALDTFRGELRDYRQSVARYKRALGMERYTMQPTTIEYTWHHIHERIDWVSEQGKPSFHDERQGLGTLGDFD